MIYSRISTMHFIILMINNASRFGHSLSISFTHFHLRCALSIYSLSSAWSWCVARGITFSAAKPSVIKSEIKSEAAFSSHAHTKHLFGLDSFTMFITIKICSFMNHVSAGRWQWLTNKGTAFSSFSSEADKHKQFSQIHTTI